MVEFILGAAVVGGFFWARGRFGRWGRGHGSGRRGGPGGLRGRWLRRRLFERLDTTPGQEKVFVQAFEGLEAAVEGLRSDLRQARLDVATALRGDSFDGDLLARALERQGLQLEKLRAALAGGLADIHATLEPGQRRQLAAFIAFHAG